MLYYLSLKNHLNLLHVNLMVFCRYSILFICPRKFSDVFVNLFFFAETLYGLKPGTFFSALGTFLTFMIIFFFGVDLSCIKLFDDPGREYFGELIPMPGGKC